MFSTLKPREVGSGHGEYILESIEVPSNRQCQKMCRLACDYCRSKKVKCTGEESGCQRCLEKRLVCRYTSPSRSDSINASIRQSTRGRHHEDRGSNAEFRDEGGGSGALQSGTEKLALDLDLDWDAIDSDYLIRDFGGTDWSISGDYGTLPDGFQDAGAVPATLATTTSQGSLGDGGDMSATPTPRNSDCFCSDMLGVLETVELRLVWVQQEQQCGQRAASPLPPSQSPQSPQSPMEILACQNDVLESCEKWLTRDVARIKSTHVVLMVSIFDKLLASVLSMFETHKNGLDNNAWGHHYAMETTGGESIPAIINNEENRHLLKTLLSFRTSRLRELLGRLAAIAGSNQWQPQTRMVQHLLVRLDNRDTL